MHSTVVPKVFVAVVPISISVGVSCGKNLPVTHEIETGFKLLDRSQTLVGLSSPYCGDMWKRYCCLTSFFPIVDTCLSCEDIARQSCAMVHRWRFFASCIFSDRLAARFRPASKICTKATPCGLSVWQTSSLAVWQTSSLRRLRLGEEKKKKKKIEQMTGQKYNGLPYCVWRP